MIQGIRITNEEERFYVELIRKLKAYNNYVLNI